MKQSNIEKRLQSIPLNAYCFNSDDRYTRDNVLLFNSRMLSSVAKEGGQLTIDIDWSSMFRTKSLKRTCDTSLNN